MVVLQSIATSMNANVISPTENSGGANQTTVVLAHGYGGNQSIWDKITPELAQNYRVMSFDWCFSGAANKMISKEYDVAKYGSFDGFADDLVNLMDEMGLKKCVFVGHSMAGMIGCIASITRPDLFDKLVLIGASPRYLKSEDYDGGFEKPEIEKLFSAIEADFQDWAATFAPIAAGGKDSAAIEKFEKSLKSMNPEVALALAKTIFLGDYRAMIKQVEAPCTIIQTTNDHVVPNSVAYYMQKRMKGKSSVEIIDVDGHFPQLTAHTQLLDVLNRVLDS